MEARSNRIRLECDFDVLDVLNGFGVIFKIKVVSMEYLLLQEFPNTAQNRAHMRIISMNDGLFAR